MKRKEIEIMAPAGNFECLQAAIQGGADSVYFGVGALNMRSHSANNFSLEDLPRVCAICRENGVKSYLTLNIVLYDDELEDAAKTLEAARDAGIDAIIASDMAAISYARSLGLEVHISTQLNISNVEALRFYAQFADVVVLARELSLPQVRTIHEAIENENICGPSGQKIRLEMFVHGALCMAVSGKCYLSLHEHGASANRGNCYQVCRRRYDVTDVETGYALEVDNQYIMSPKDLCTIGFIDKIADAGVQVFKIEGRARSAEYVRTCARCYRRAADAVCQDRQAASSAQSAHPALTSVPAPDAPKAFTPQLAAALKDELATVFNRGFWDGYYQGARLGEWSEAYGNRASRTKIYCGKVTNWFARIGVAEILPETVPLTQGDTILFIGATTGVVEMKVSQLRVGQQAVTSAQKGDYCSIAVPPEVFEAAARPGNAPSPRLHRGDKVYIWKENL